MLYCENCKKETREIAWFIVPGGNSKLLCKTCFCMELMFIDREDVWRANLIPAEEKGEV